MQSSDCDTCTYEATRVSLRDVVPLDRHWLKLPLLPEFSINKAAELENDNRLVPIMCQTH